MGEPEVRDHRPVRVHRRDGESQGVLAVAPAARAAGAAPARVDVLVIGRRKDLGPVRAAIGCPVDDGHAGVAAPRQVGYGGVAPRRSREEGVVSGDDARGARDPGLLAPVQRVDRPVVGVVSARHAGVDIAAPKRHAEKAGCSAFPGAREGNHGLAGGDSRHGGEGEGGATVGGVEEARVRTHMDRAAVKEGPRHIAAAAVRIFGPEAGPAVRGQIEGRVIGHEQPVRAFGVRGDRVGTSAGGVRRQMHPGDPAVGALAGNGQIVRVINGVEDVRVGGELHLAALARGSDLPEVRQGPSRAHVARPVEPPHVAGSEGQRRLVGAQRGRVERSAAPGASGYPDRRLGAGRRSGAQTGRGQDQDQKDRRPAAHRLGPAPQALTAVTR